MDIRIKRTARILWEFPDVVAIALMEMFPNQVEPAKVSYQERLSMLEAERQKGKPQTGLEIKFTIEKNRQTEKIQIVLRCGSEEVLYDGPPVHAPTAFGGGTRTVPAHVVEEYARVLEYNKPVDLHAEIERRLRAKQAPAQPYWPRYGQKPE